MMFFRFTKLNTTKKFHPPVSLKCNYAKWRCVPSNSTRIIIKLVDHRNTGSKYLICLNSLQDLMKEWQWRLAFMSGVRNHEKLKSDRKKNKNDFHIYNCKHSDLALSFSV